MSGGSISLICKNRASDLLIGGAVSLSLVVELGESILRAADEAAHIFPIQVMRMPFWQQLRIRKLWQQ